MNVVIRGILVAGALLWPALAGAQSYPTKTVRMIIPQQPGSSSDILGRYLADGLSKLWGQAVVIENRPGAAGMIATRHVTQSGADGYTLLFHSSTLSGAAATQSDFNAAKELQPVAVVATGDMLIITGTRTSLPDLKQLVTQAKTQKLFMASSGPGTAGELVLLSLLGAAGIKLEPVMYKSPPEALIDLVGGRVDVFSTSTTTYLSSAAVNKSTPVAIASRSRTKKLPNVPTATELGYPDVVLEPWWGLLVPAGTPANIVNKLNQDVTAIMSRPEAVEFLERSDNRGEKMSVQEATNFIFGDINKAKQLIDKQAAGAK